MGKRVTLVVWLLVMVVIGLWSSEGRTGRGTRPERAGAAESRDPTRGVELVPARKTEAPGAPQSTIPSTRGAREAHAREEDELAAIVGTLALAPGLLLAPDETIEDAELCWSDGDVRGYWFPEADGAFALEGLPVGAALTLEARADFGAAFVRVTSLVGGERRRVDLVLARGSHEHTPTRRAAGRVLDEEGKPVQGVRVYGVASLPEPGLAARDTRTDENGEFFLRELPAEICRVGVSGGVAVGTELEIDLRAADPAGLELRVVRGVALEGEVLWPDGAPAAEFWIRAGRRSEHGENGRFRIPGFLLEPLDFTIEAHRPESFGHLTGIVRPGSPSRLVLSEVRKITLSVSVMDEAGNALDAEVGCSWYLEGHSAWEKGHGHGPGVYELRLPTARGRLAVWADGFHALEREILAESDDELCVTLEHAGWIRGRVLDPEGEPIGGARICGFDVVSRPDGGFELPSPSAHFMLAAEFAGFASSRSLALDVPAGGVVADVELRLRTACSVRGRVVGASGETGYAIEGEEWGHSTATDASGEFFETDLPTGWYEAYAIEGEETVLAGPRVRFEAVSGETARIELRRP